MGRFCSRHQYTLLVRATDTWVLQCQQFWVEALHISFMVKVTVRSITCVTTCLYCDCDNTLNIVTSPAPAPPVRLDCFQPKAEKRALTKQLRQLNQKALWVSVLLGTNMKKHTCSRLPYKETYKHAWIRMVYTHTRACAHTRTHACTHTLRVRMLQDSSFIYGVKEGLCKSGK